MSSQLYNELKSLTAISADNFVKLWLEKHSEPFENSMRKAAKKGFNNTIYSCRYDDISDIAINLLDKVLTNKYPEFNITINREYECMFRVNVSWI